MASEFHQNGVVVTHDDLTVRQSLAGRSLDEASLERSRVLVGLRGYVTNIPATIMAAAEVLSSYHDLWQVEQSF